MSWTRYFMHDFFTAQEFDKRDERLRRDRIRERRRERNAQDLAKRVEELQDHVERLSLLTCTLLELGLQGGFTQEQFLEAIQRLDLDDDEQDGKLDPVWLQGLVDEEDPQSSDSE